MTVNFKGGTSGSVGKDFLPSVPSSGTPQPILRTETHEAVPSTIHLQAENPKAHPDHYQSRTPDFMPTCGTTSTMNPDGTMGHYPSPDVSQDDIRNLPDTTSALFPEYFKGAPNDGTKGGPA